MKGLENAIRNLNSLDTRMVPQASAWAINRVAQKAVSVATRQVAGNTVAGDNQVKGIPATWEVSRRKHHQRYRRSGQSIQ
ncbi:phage tail protein, partial [Escherichia coli]|uniref:phage tail protein n=1 Tax=Escherichia coli TaxID=562 RepID=UPI0021E91CC2